MLPGRRGVIREGHELRARGVVDLEREWAYDVARSASKSRNTPFDGRKLRGRAMVTIVNREIVWRENGNG